MLPKFKIARGVPLSFLSTDDPKVGNRKGCPPKFLQEVDPKIQNRKGCPPKFFYEDVIPKFTIARGVPLSFSINIRPLQIAGAGGWRGWALARFTLFKLFNWGWELNHGTPRTPDRLLPSPPPRDPPDPGPPPQYLNYLNYFIGAGN